MSCPLTVVKVNVFLIRLPRSSGPLQQTGEVLVGVLVRAARNLEGIVVVQHAKIGSRFRPQVVWLGRMNVRVVSAGSRQNVMVRRRVGDLLADVHEAGRRRRPVRFRSPGY